jgi:hypothetical protein
LHSSGSPVMSRIPHRPSREPRGPRSRQPRVRRATNFCACGCGSALSGRQTKFASKDCANKLYETARPRILNASAGAPREGTIKAAVLGVLFDREWHSAHELAAAVKADKHSVVTRISELRKHFDIEEDLPVGNSRRSHRYRLVPR